MYLIHAGLLLSACFLYYWLLLRNETHFALNRWILLGCLAGSLLLPLVTVPAGWSLKEALTIEETTPLPEAAPTAAITSKSDPIPSVKATPKEDLKAEIKGEAKASPELLDESARSGTEAPAVANTAAPTSKVDWFRLLWWVYLGGVAIFGIHFLVQFGYLIRKVIRHPGFDAGGFHLVELREDAAPYSFWNRVFLNPDRYDPETYHQIVQHEAVHVRQRHSLDLLLAELVVVVQWCNPFAWLYRRAIENNLEFLTDAEVLRQGEDPVGYQMSLVRVAVPNFPLGLTTSYNQSLLEKRIAMMKTKKSSLASGWKYLTIAPLLLLSMLQFNAVAQVSPSAPTASVATPGTQDMNAVPTPNPAPATAPEVVIDNQRIPNATSTTGTEIVSNNVSNSINRSVNANVQANVVEPNSHTKTVDLPSVEPVMDVTNADFEKARRSWTAEIDGNEVCFTFIVTQDNRQHLSTNSRCFPRTALGTLPTGQMGDFSLKRESGTITFNGVFNGDEGLGSFNYVPDPAFKRMLAAKGYEEYEDMELLHFFFIDFTSGYLDYLNREGYKPSQRELFKLAIFGFSEREFRTTLAGYKAAGYGKPGMDKMIKLRIHGVSNEYIKEVSDLGFKGLSLDEITKAKIHGLSAEFVQDMSKAGFRNLEFDEVINMSIHGVSSEYVTELKNLGYDNLTAEEVVGARIHGVRTESIRKLRELGLGNLSLEEARNASIHGVTESYVRELSDLGYTDLNVEEVISAKIHGVSKRKIGDLNKAGMGKLSLEEARNASIHGVTESYVRELSDLGYTDLNIEEVVSAKIHGVSKHKIGDLNKAGLTNLTLKEARNAAVHGVNASQVEALREMGYTELEFKDFVNARIHGISPRFVRSYQDLGYGKIPFKQLMKLKIHGVSANYIRKYRRDGDSIDDMINDKIHGRHRR